MAKRIPDKLKADKAERKRHSRINRYEGTDVYSWALFIRNRPVVTGISKSEAGGRRRRYIEEGIL